MESTVRNEMTLIASKTTISTQSDQPEINRPMYCKAEERQQRKASKDKLSNLPLELFTEIIEKLPLIAIWQVSNVNLRYKNALDTWPRYETFLKTMPEIEEMLSHRVWSLHPIHNSRRRQRFESAVVFVTEVYGFFQISASRRTTSAVLRHHIDEPCIRYLQACVNGARKPYADFHCFDLEDFDVGVNEARKPYADFYRVDREDFDLEWLLFSALIHFSRRVLGKALDSTVAIAADIRYTRLWTNPTVSRAVAPQHRSV